MASHSPQGALESHVTQSHDPVAASPQHAVKSLSSPAEDAITTADVPETKQPHVPEIDTQDPHIHDEDELRVDSQNDNDSALGGSSFMSSTASLNSSMFEFVEEYGRKWHKYKAGRYMLPNDEVDLQHHFFNATIGGLYVAPLKNLEGGIHNVLDIGCGTGIWALDFADEFPSADVIGIDLSPIQPLYVTPNCRFQVDDAEDPWLYSHKFDYIHGRALLTCFKSHLGVFRQAFEFTRPGGYFEMQDGVLPFQGFDDTIKGTHFEQWMGLIMEGIAKLGKNWSKTPTYKSLFEEVGFEDVNEKIHMIPMGRWARGKRMKTLGMWALEDILSTLHGLSMPLMVRGLGMSEAAVEALLVDVRKDFNNPGIHICTTIHVVWGRKPK